MSQDTNFQLLNFGPQHPAAHGVLRLVLALDGEVIKKADPHIGLLHRGTEKLREQKDNIKALPYRDRLDYVSRRAQEHAFILSVEALLKINVPLRAQYIRVIFSELTRILNHLMALTTHARDVGALTPFLWGFQEREYILELYERVSGSRRHASYFRPGGVYRDLPYSTLDKIYEFIIYFQEYLDGLRELLSCSSIWVARLKQVGFIKSPKIAKSFGFSGPRLRGSGETWDLRRVFPYEIYNNLQFSSFSGKNSDCLDRYYLRVNEMQQSLYIIEQCLNQITTGPVQDYNSNVALFPRHRRKDSRENLIYHFKVCVDNTSELPRIAYRSIEAPKGETGVLIVGNAERTQYRVKLRAPGFYHLQGLHSMVENHLLTDAVTVIGTQDIVFGEVDR